MDWHDARSDVVHGVFNAVDKTEADEAEFWVSHYLA